MRAIMKFAFFMILNELTFLQKTQSIGFGEKVNDLLNMVNSIKKGMVDISYVFRGSQDVADTKH